MRSRWRGLVLLVVAGAVAGAVCLRNPQPLTGTVSRRLAVGGVERTYLLHAGGAPRPGRPLVLVLHGWKGNATGIERRTGGRFNDLADQNGAVIAYPQALGEPQRWNDGWFERPGASLPDDVGFLVALVDALVAELGVDRKQVFAAGLSNGASMVYRLACERPDLVAAVAPVSGSMSPQVANACARGAPVAIVGMHGTTDPLVPLDHRIRDGVAQWVQRDGCPAAPARSRLPDADPGDGTQTRVDSYGPCADGTAVAFYTIEGGGHAWPGGAEPFFVVPHGNAPRDFDAGVMIWAFFRQHARR